MPEDITPQPQNLEHEDKVEKEKNELLARLKDDSLTDIKTQVAFILNHYPHTRNNDISLTIQFWRIFDKEIVGNAEALLLKDIHKITRAGSIVRARAKIQNTYGLFVAVDEVRRKRAQLAEDESEKQVEDQPDLPLVSVFCDESGKTDETIIVGSVWINDGYQVYKINSELTKWKKENEITREFHFSDLTRLNAPQALGFLRAALAQSAALAFKAVLVRKNEIGTQTIDDAIYRLHCQLIIQGMQHEVTSGRLTLPRVITVTKDKDDGADRIRLVELNQKLKQDCRGAFNSEAEVQTVEAEDSNSNLYLQLTDLFTGSINRVLNRAANASRNHKDDFADQALQLLGISPALEVDLTKQDFVKVIRI